MATRPSVTTEGLRRAFWAMAAALALLVLAFAAYYIWDRYTHPAEQTDADAAVTQIEQAIRHDPSDPDLRVALAEAYLQTGRYQDALSQAEEVLSLYPENQAALLVAGLAAVRLNRPEAALPSLERFVALRKDGRMAGSDMALEMAYYFLGESYLKLDRAADAIPVLEAAIEINAVDADALYQAGLAYGAAEQPEAALEKYYQAVRLVPDFAEAYHGMCTVYEAQDQPHYLAYARGMVAFSEHNYQPAVTYLEQATDSLPDFAPAFLGLGLTYEQLGRLDDALDAVQRAAELAPDDFATRQAASRIQAALEAEK